MGTNLNKNTSTPLSKNGIGLIPNGVPNEARNIINTNLVIKHEEMENCFTFERHLVKVTREHELPQATLIENEIISTSTVQLEPDSDHSKDRRLSGDILGHKWDELEATLVQSEEKIIPKIEEYTWDSSDAISGSNLNGTLEFSSKQLEILKTENSEFKSEINKWPEVAYNDWKIKNEEVDPKEEDLIEKEIECKEFSSKQLLRSIKNDDTETKSETEKWPEVVYDDWKTKNEEVDLKEEGLLETSSQSMWQKRQEKYYPEKKFKCHVCDYQTERKWHLKQHLLTHNKKIEEVDSFRCNKCEYVTRYKGALNNHSLRHKNQEEVYLFKCDKCEYATRYRSCLKKHILRHKNLEEVDLFKCDKCEFVTRYKSGLKSHALHKSGLKSHALLHKKPEELDLFRCDRCEYMTCFKYALKKHVLGHTNPKLDFFKCETCEYVTRFKSDLKCHALRHKKLEEVDLFKCDKCKYVTRFKSYLKSHVLRHKKPKDDDLLRCDKCEYVTRFKHALRNHVLGHKNPEDLFKCDTCKYVTNFKCALKRHSLRHKNPEEIELFGCDKCEYQTRYKEHLKKHQKVHQSQKPRRSRFI